MKLTVDDPDGNAWTVERSWLPGLGGFARSYSRWYRRRKGKGQGDLGDGLNPFDFDAGDDIVGWIVGVIVIAIVGLLVIALGGWLFLPFALLIDVLVALPLLVAVPVLRALGVVKFVVAARLADDDEPLTWRVRGVRRSAATARHLAAIIASGDTPPLAVADLLRGVQD